MAVSARVREIRATAVPVAVTERASRTDLETMAVAAEVTERARAAARWNAAVPVPVTLRIMPMARAKEAEPVAVAVRACGVTSGAGMSDSAGLLIGGDLLCRKLMLSCQSWCCDSWPHYGLFQRARRGERHHEFGVLRRSGLVGHQGGHPALL